MIPAASATWRAAAHAALLAGAGVAAVPALAEPTSQTVAFAPPVDRPLVLSRKVVRELNDGKSIIATRRYRITFHPVANGWEVAGVLIASEIDVPPSLAAIAAFERERPDDGLFPIHLDRSGRIVAATTVIPSAAETRAVSGALDMAGRRAEPVDPAPSDGFLDQIAKAAASPGGGHTLWPETLFMPSGRSATSEQTIELDDGSRGSVQVTIESEAALVLATMGRARRTVVTMAAGTRRVAREEWTLAPLAPPPR